MKKKKVHIIEPTISPANSTELGFSKLRVAAYARVSTDTDEQENSLSYQKLFYERKIASNPNWIFVGLYTDLGISGLSTKHRDGFNHLVDDALNGKIDKILTKSISRFARNTVDTLTTVRLLKSVGVSVFF